MYLKYQIKSTFYTSIKPWVVAAFGLAFQKIKKILHIFIPPVIELEFHGPDIFSELSEWFKTLTLPMLTLVRVNVNFERHGFAGRS